METTKAKAKARRTAGEWKQLGNGVFGPPGSRTLPSGRPTTSIVCNTGAADDAMDKANARTIALAGTAANAVDAMGLDGDAAIAALPDLIDALMRVRNAHADNVQAPTYAIHADMILARLRPATSTK